MKRLILTLLIGLTLGSCFPPDRTKEYERRSEERALRLENQLHQERELTNNWRYAAFGLGVVSVVLLIIGTAIGSKGRSDAGRK